jgi:hypothetical protein
MSEAAASVSKLARAITAIERGEVLEQDVAEFLLRRLDELSGVHERQLTMMYEGVRGALAGMRPITKPKC